MDNNKFDQEKFRELLRKGIGLRTQKQFAEQTGIAHATINRMLNDDTISCPRLKTLETFADHMLSVSLEELMEACGYEVPDINEMVKTIESDIADYFAFGEDMVSYDSIDDLADRLDAFVNKCHAVVTYEETDNDGVPENLAKRGAEDRIRFNVKWNYEKYTCTTIFNVFYTISRNNRFILVDTDINDKKEHTFINSANMTPEERLLACIFGIDTGEVTKIPTNTPGYGLEFNDTPEGFMDFLNLHAGTFCDTTEHAEMYKRIITGEDIETVFKGYRFGSADIGPCAVIAEIMSKETGRSFAFYDEEFSLPDDTKNACIMEYIPLPFGRPDAPDKKLINYLYDCAKTLKIKKFGLVFYHTFFEKVNKYQFDTDTFSC